MSNSGGLHCKNHGGHIGPCKDCVIDDLKNQLENIANDLSVVREASVVIYRLDKERDSLLEEKTERNKWINAQGVILVETLQQRDELHKALEQIVEVLGAANRSSFNQIKQAITSAHEICENALCELEYLKYSPPKKED